MSLQRIFAKNLERVKRERGHTFLSLELESGYCASSIHRVTSEEVCPDLLFIEVICQVLNVSVEEMLKE